MFKERNEEMLKILQVWAVQYEKRSVVNLEIRPTVGTLLCIGKVTSEMIRTLAPFALLH
jgi:hypothetical protein